MLAILLFVCSFLAHGAAEDDTRKTLQDMVDALEDRVLSRVAKLEEEHVDDMTRIKDSLEDRVEKLEDLVKIGTQRSCAEYTKYGLTTSGPYMVDPDGSPIGQKPFQVFCNFTTGATEIMHDIENITEVDHCPDPGCYQKNITYIDGSSAEPISMSQIVSLIELSAYCEQEITYDCFLAPLTDNDVDYAFWEDRHGEQNIYWTGSNYGSHVCDCHHEAKGCLEENTKSNKQRCHDNKLLPKFKSTCNCDAVLPVLGSDSGTITNSTALPIMKMFFGGLIYEIQSGAFQLGRLKCYGEKDVDIGTSCSSLKKQGVTKSGYYNILEEGSSSTKIVFCDMKSGTYDDLTQVDQVSNASPLGTILAWVPKPENGQAAQTIPDGWLPCNGTSIPKGPWAGGRTPDLNTVGAFLRGGQDDKILEMEDDQVEDHQHKDAGHSHSCSATSSQSSHRHSYSRGKHDDSGEELCGKDGGGCADDDSISYDTQNTEYSSATITTSCSTNSHHSGISGMDSSSRHGSETRPINMKIKYVIRCW